MCMPKLPVLKPKKIIAILKLHGFRLDHVTGSHHVFYHPQKHSTVTVPLHNRDIPKGTLFSILKQAGLSGKDL